MKRTLTNIIMLLAVPLTLLPIVLGACDALKAEQMERFWQMRREHLRSLARDRHNRPERERRRNEELRREREAGQLPSIASAREITHRP